MGRPTNWSELQALTVVLERRSFAAASRVLGLSEATVRKRIEHLEALGRTELFVRTATGLEPTADGLAAGALARQMVEHSLATERFLRDRSRDDDGEVRITATDGLGTYWVVPKLAKRVFEGEPGRYDVTCKMEVPNLELGEADVAVHLEAIDGKNIETRCVGKISVRLHASRDYVEEKGIPKIMPELAHHRLVLQTGAQLGSDGAEGPTSLLASALPVFMRLDTSGAHFQAVAAGAGIGAIPTYVAAVTSDVIELDLPLELKRDVFVSASRDRLRVKKVREAYEVVAGLFDAPYFGSAG